MKEVSLQDKSARAELHQGIVHEKIRQEEKNWAEPHHTIVCAELAKRAREDYLLKINLRKGIS